MRSTGVFIPVAGDGNGQGFVVKFVSFKGRGFLFHAVVLAGTLQSTDFKSIYSNQFKRYEYIQDIWEMQNCMKNTMTKKFWARAQEKYSVF